MFIPLWFIVAMVAIGACLVVLDVLRLLKRRHHDHLVPPTPRAPRG